MSKHKKLAVAAGYAAFGALALLVCLYLTFPADAVGQRLAHEVQRSSGGQLTMSFAGVSLDRLTGVEAEGVKVRAARDGQQPLEFQLDTVRARLRLLPLLWLSLSVDAEIEAGDGSVAVRFTPGSDGSFAADVELDDFDVARPPILPMLLGMPIGGRANGELSIELASDTKASTGKGVVSIAQASLGPGAVQGFTLPSIDLGKLDIELALEAGKLRVASFKQEGGQLAAKLSGTSQVRPQFSASSLDACIEVKPEPTFLEQNPKMKTAMQLAEIQLKKNPQGFLNVPLVGTLGKPRLRNGLCRASRE